MKKTFALFSLFCFLVILSCDEEIDPISVNELAFNLNGAKAILYSQEGLSSGRSKAEESHLFKIENNGTITPVLEGIEVVSAQAISWGLIVTIVDTGAGAFRTFYVKTDNTFGEIDGNIGTFIGENDNGDVVFSNSIIFRKSTLIQETIQTTLSSPRVQAMSGNFAIVTDNSVYQIFNTVNGVRYNVMGCNGPRIVAMDATHSLIDDCQNEIVIDMATGERKEGDISMWNQEGVRSENGAVLLSQALGDDFDLYYLGEIDLNGDLTLVNEYGFDPGSSSCMNCSDPNSVLFKTGDYFIVRELSKVAVVKRGVPDPVFILSGYNVTSISVKNNLVYYLAEDNTGHPITGIYNLNTSVNEVLSDTKQFTEIQAIN